MKFILLFTTLLFGSTLSAQTKKIFHKSHSGKSSTLFMDANNNFGPGMAPVRYRTPVSSIKLNYALTKKNEYPLVKLDRKKKTLRFFDIKDSLLGCDRNYEEYITHGDLVFDVVTNEFYVYQSHCRLQDYHNWEKSNVFLPVSDSIESWESKKNYIRKRDHFIRDGNNARILMSYPRLDNRVTYRLDYLTPKRKEEAQPIIIDKDIEKKDEKIIKKEKKRVKKEEEKQVKIEQKEEENVVPIVPTFASPKSNYLLRWMTLILLVFALFIFVGVQRIVKDELAKTSN
ncbi:MAG: hypothetical protein ABF242_09755 [Flavobacteriales bacterium]